jgi:hypothetical protein
MDNYNTTVGSHCTALGPLTCTCTIEIRATTRRSIESTSTMSPCCKYRAMQKHHHHHQLLLLLQVEAAQQLSADDAPCDRIYLPVPPKAPPSRKQAKPFKGHAMNQWPVNVRTSSSLAGGKTAPRYTVRRCRESSRLHHTLASRLVANAPRCSIQCACV